MNDTLSLQDVRDLAPAAFATVAHPRTSDKYSLFRTADIVDSLIEAGWSITRAGQDRGSLKRANRDYTRHLVALSRPDLTYKDERIEALLFNSNDGRSAFHFELGVYRFICANGIIDSSTNLAELELRHFGYNQEQVATAAHRIVERAPDVLAVIDAWKCKELTWEQQLRLANFASAVRFGSDTPITAGALLTVRREQDAGNSLWKTFNRIQENALKGGLAYVKESRTRSGTRHMNTRPIRSIRGNADINRKLWSAAECLYADKDLVLAS
jgi:Domain of unknown function (DUF932)